MTGHWFRVYDDLVSDPKVQRLPVVSFKFLINLWCICSASAGRLPDLKSIAFKQRVQERKASRLIQELTDAGLIDETEQGLVIHNWSGRQFKSDRSNERVEAFRKRSKAATEVVAGNDDVTLHATPPDTDTETERKKEGSEAKASGVPPVDERGKLFSDGLKAVKRITGQPDRNARALIGRWLKATGDDCLTVGRLIEDAERDRRADPVAWIEAHFRPRPPNGAPPGAKINPDGTFERWAI